MATGSQFGAFLPTTEVYDIIPDNLNLTTEEMSLLMVRLRQIMNNSALITNIKDSGYYLPTEFVNGQQYFANPDVAITNPQAKNTQFRQVYRMLVDFGALPNTATKSVAHNIPGITSAFTFTRMYGAATDPVALSYLAIPNSNITMTADATNVNITTVANLTAYTRTYLVLEYLKD